MELLEYFARQFTYDEWANRQVLAGLKKSTGDIERARKLLAHIVAAERLWLERILKQPQSLPVWPDFSLQECETQVADVAERWRQFFQQLTFAGLAQEVSYRNSKGELFENSVQDISTYVLLHSAYHRGQIASQVRAAGDTPAYTDFIHAVRQGHLK